MTKQSNSKCIPLAEVLEPIRIKVSEKILFDIEEQILSTEAVRHVVLWPAGDAIGDRIGSPTIDQIQDPV